MEMVGDMWDGEAEKKDLVGLQEDSHRQDKLRWSTIKYVLISFSVHKNITLCS